MSPTTVDEELAGMARPADWDGMGAPAIDDRTCRAAAAFLTMARGAGIPDPDHASPNALGAISFEWDRGDSSLYVRVHSDDDRGCCVVRDDGRGGRSEAMTTSREAVEMAATFLATGTGG